VNDPKHHIPGASWAGQPHENTTGDYRLTDHNLQVLVIQLQGALTSIRNEITYINNICSSPGYVEDGCKHAIDYLEIADTVAAKINRMSGNE
jgi:hypothetical protein